VYCSAYRALELISPRLSPALVPEDTLHKVLGFAAKHRALGQTQYLECRLGQGGPGQVDLLISAGTALDRGALERALAGPSGDAPELWPLHRFVAAWVAPGSLLHRSVPVTWLEFDHLESDPRPVASLGVCLAPSYLDPFASLPRQPAVEVLPVISETLAVIRQQPPSAREAACFERCFRRLPEGARYIHLSIMAGRDPLELKLYGEFPAPSLLPYLREVGWRGDLARVADLLARHGRPEQMAEVVYLDLPVTGMLADATSGLGVVFTQQHLRIARDRDAARPALLDRLMVDGLCSPEERDGLSAWTGSEVVRLDGGAEGSQARRRIDRWLDIKLVQQAQASGGLLAKAYLGFAARPTSPTTPAHV
jgi:hypothetical protein